MLRVRDIMTPAVVTINADQTLREAIETLLTCKISGVPVLDGDRVVGVIAATDILEFQSVTALGRRYIESPDELTPLEESEEWDEGNDAGATYFTDMWSQEGSDVVERMSAAEGPEWDYLSEHTASEAMTRAVCLVRESMEVSVAARRMLAAGVHRALVRDAQQNLCGILTTTDVLRAVAERRISLPAQAAR